MDLTITVKAYPIPSGGAITTQDFKDSVAKLTIVSSDNGKNNSGLKNLSTSLASQPWRLTEQQNSKLSKQLKG